jgi:hypothetical protein
MLPVGVKNGYEGQELVYTNVLLVVTEKEG